MNNIELDQFLRHFYAEARTKDGALYSRLALLGLRNAIEWFLNNPPFNKGISITKGSESDKVEQERKQRKPAAQTLNSKGRPCQVKVTGHNARFSWFTFNSEVFELFIPCQHLLQFQLQWNSFENTYTTVRANTRSNLHWK